MYMDKLLDKLNNKILYKRKIMDNKWEEHIDSIIKNINISGPYSTEEIINFIIEVIHSNEGNESSIHTENEEAQTNLRDISITDLKEQICSRIYREYIETYSQKSVGELNIIEIEKQEKQEKQILLLIYVIHRLEFDLKEKNIINLLKGINHCNSKEYFLALTTLIDYSSEKDELFESLMNFFTNNNNIKIILNDQNILSEMCKILNNKEFCTKAIDNQKFIETIYFFDFKFEVQEKHELKKQLRSNIIENMSPSQAQDFFSIFTKKKFDKDIWNSLLKIIKKFDDKTSEFKKLIEQIIEVNKTNPQNLEDFVNIINYLISKEPKIFVNKSLIEFILTLYPINVHILEILVTIFEHYDEDGTKLDEVLSKIKWVKENGDFSNVNEEFCAVLIIFLNEKSKALNEVFDDGHLDYLLEFFEKKISVPDSPRFRRIIKATVCICNYYYQQTNNSVKFKEGISKISKILEKAFPFRNKQQSNVQESFGDSDTYLYSILSNVDEQNLNESEQCSSGNNLSQNNNDSSHFFSSISKSKSSLFDSTSEDFYPHKEYPDDIYDYVKSNLNEKLKKHILDYETIESILKSENDEQKINILKLWSLCVLPDEEKELSIFSKNKEKELNDLYKSHQEVIEKLLIFKSKPIKSKIKYYFRMINFPKENETKLENPFKLVQNNFNYILNDFKQLKSSEEDKKNRKYIILFCSSKIDTQSLDNTIKFFYDKYEENNGENNRETKLFIRSIISNHIQNWLQKETNMCNPNLKETNMCNTNLCKLVWKFLPFNELKDFPKSLTNTITDKRPIYFYIYLLKSFMEGGDRERYRGCLSESGKILIENAKDCYEKDINQFFKKVKQYHSEFYISNEISEYLQQLN